MNEEIIVSGASFTFKRLEDDSWLWTVQICVTPHFYGTGISDSKESADVHAQATAAALRRLARRDVESKLEELRV